MKLATWNVNSLAIRLRVSLFEQPPNILVSEALKPQTISCSIDKQPRKHARPSDHAPVMIEFQA